MLKGYYNVPEERVLVIAEGDEVSLGTCSLRFYMVPMVHWPETMVTWLEDENTVFSGDAFGTFGVVGEDIVDSEDTFDLYRDEMIRYYSNIVGKYGVPVQAALKKLVDSGAYPEKLF
jgi:flavorubredoxin